MSISRLPERGVKITAIIGNIVITALTGNAVLTQGWIQDFLKGGAKGITYERCSLWGYKQEEGSRGMKGGERRELENFEKTTSIFQTTLLFIEVRHTGTAHY